MKHLCAYCNRHLKTVKTKEEYQKEIIIELIKNLEEIHSQEEISLGELIDLLRYKYLGENIGKE